MISRLIASALLSLAVPLGLTGSTSNWTPDLRTADILVIGDSQIMFRGGDAYVAFFERFADVCRAASPEQAPLFDDLANLRVGVLGVRSTATPDWVARDPKGKAKVCVPEKSWPVNAKGFGALHDPVRKWVQVGKFASYPLCQKGISPVEALFQTAQAQPKLLVLTFLGRAANRWATSATVAEADAAALATQVPRHVPCLSMTTAPSFRAKVNTLRAKAQTNINAALARQDGTCRPVDGLTPDTIRKLQNNKEFFKTNAAGKVRDPFHPKGEGVRVFLESIAPQLCSQAAASLTRAKKVSGGKP